MPDWSALVKDRLGRLGLDPGRESEIFAELAGHFEDLSEEDIGGGLSEKTAMLRALGEVRDWKLLRRDIRRVEIEEVVMKHRTMSVWLPGLVTGALAWLLYPGFVALGLHPRIVGTAYPPLIFFLPWMLALPLIGALGAFGSRRAGGNSREMILAGIFPVLAMTALFVLLFPVALADLLFGRGGTPLSAWLSGFACSILGWVIIPGATLLVGALVVTLTRRHEPMPPTANSSA